MVGEDRGSGTCSGNLLEAGGAAARRQEFELFFQRGPIIFESSTPLRLSAVLSLVAPLGNLSASLTPSKIVLKPPFPSTLPPAMSAEQDPAQRVAIGISFGNSYSSIAYTTGVSSVCVDFLEIPSDTTIRTAKLRLLRTKTEVCHRHLSFLLLTEVSNRLD